MRFNCHRKLKGRYTNAHEKMGIYNEAMTT